MTRSIFDPNSGETERSGNRFVPEEAEQISPIVQNGATETERAAEDAAEADQADEGQGSAAQGDLNQIAEAEQELEAEHSAQRKAKFSGQAAPKEPE